MIYKQHYSDALKLGQKEFRHCTAAGQYPYLPTLDSFLQCQHLPQSIDLGVVMIPLEFVVGTRTEGRTNAFARNFMPLMPMDSEFATKWEALCQSHVEEGIRDPILCYEYLNRYYVEEGNKRVSVLRYFDAQNIYAHVKRIMPQQHTRENQIYYEYLDFYKLSRINYIEFSRPGSYARLQQLVGKGPAEPWSDDDRRSFSAAYYSFRQAYDAKGGEHLTSTVGDALLAYVDVYGYQFLRQQNAAELKRSVSQVWEEITLQQETEPIDVKLEPEGKPAGNILTKVLSKSEPKTMKVAFIHDKDPALSGWTYGHELGREHVQRVFEGKLETKAYFNVLDHDPGEVIEQAIADGSTVLFTTSPRLLTESLRAAVYHPKTTILNCSLNMSHRYIRTYYARMYEAKFIAGVIAGSLAGSDSVGYICDYPIYGQVAGINAFALGVQAADPLTKVFLEWSSVGGVEGAARRLTDRGIRLISSQDLARLRDNGHTPFGLSIVNGDSLVTLARPIWQWGVYYESILRSIQDKSFHSQYAESSKALNYYWGMSAGVVEMRYSAKLPAVTRKMAGFLERAIRAGICEPFRGPLYDQNSHRIVAEGQALTTEQIINMNWLNENISGSIPAYEDLNDTGKATVGIAGVIPASDRPQTLQKGGDDKMK